MIYFDESGNSGANLLDTAQPTYLLLSHNYSLNECTSILSPLLELSNAEELHFKNLKKYQKTRNAILKCINDERILSSRIYRFVAHKEFMIVAQIVDQLIELVLSNNGIDIYKGGLNISTSNMIYLLGKNLWNKTLFKEMCENFVKWIRSNSEADFTIFYKSVSELYHSIQNEKEKLFVGLILLSKPFKDTVMDAYDKYTLDITLSCFVSHCNFWAEENKNPFDVVFDSSKQIDYWKDMIKFLTDKLPSQEVGYGSRKYKYPLLINSIEMVNSKSEIQIQFADIMSSSLNYTYSCISKNSVDDFSSQIEKSRLFETSGNAIWPTTLVTPEDLDMTDDTGINPLDFFVKHSMLQNL